MTYEKTEWWDNPPSKATPITADRLNHLETQYDEAMAGVALGYVPYGYKLVPDPIRPILGLESSPPGTTARGPIETTTIYNVTDANPTQLVSLGDQSLTIYGGADYGSVPAKGIAHGETTLMDVVTSVDDMNEHSATMGWMRYAAGAKGRAWFTDWSLLGPIGTRPGLLNGITMLVNNYYNGTPIYGSSAGQWIVTKPTSGAGGETGHTAAVTYKADVGIGIVGFAGQTFNKTRGFEVGLQIGGYGSGWMTSAETSIIGTGIVISDTEVRALQINPTGVGGEIRWGTSAAIRPIGTDGLMIMTGATAAHKLGFYGKTPVARAAALPAAATDLTSAIALLNAIRASLIGIGLNI